MRGNDMERWLAPGWADRLVAWWEGYDLAALRATHRGTSRPRPHPLAFRPEMPSAPPPADTAVRAVSAVLGSVAAEHQQRTGQAGWTQEHAEGAQFLWGDGRIGPAFDDSVLETAREIDLGRGSDILDAAADLGGMARALTTATGARVVGLEPDPVLALLAASRAEAEGLATCAPVFTYDPDRFVAPGSFDLAVGDGILRRATETDHFVNGLARSLRPSGRLVLFDYAHGARLSPRDFDRWAEVEGEPPRLLRIDAVARAAEASGLRITAVQDATLLLRERIARTLRALLNRLRATARDTIPLRGLAREFEVWGARYAALGQGAAFFRMVAARPS